MVRAGVVLGIIVAVLGAAAVLLAIVAFTQAHDAQTTADAAAADCAAQHVPTAPPPPALTETRARVAVVGGGMGGHSAMYELARAGIGNAANPGPSGNKGLLLIEKTSSPCGIIKPITFYPESSPNADSAAINNPFDPSYMPYRVTPHANSINRITQPGMRCLARDLRLPVQYMTDNGVEIWVNGYKTRTIRWNQGRDGVEDGVWGSTNGFCHEFNAMLGTSLLGNGCLVAQTNNVPETADSIAFTIPTLPGDFAVKDPLDQAISWLVGYAGAPNPTFNYSGDGTTFNGATADPFDPEDPAQDHPRWTCHAYKDTYAILTHYLGLEYAKFVETVDFGFRADFTGGNDPCAYFGKGLVDGFAYRDRATTGAGVPVGSMTEFCTRQRHQVTTNAFGTGVTGAYANNEPALAIAHTTGSAVSKGKYVVTTPLRRIYADELVLNLHPAALAGITGNVAAALNADPHMQYPHGLPVVTIWVKWAAGGASAWLDTFMADMWFGYGRIDAAGCLNRLNMVRVPYWTAGGMHAVRVVYTDYTCLEMWKALLRLDNPAFETAPIAPAAGYPLAGAVATEAMRQLRYTLAGPGSHANVSSIPDPAYVYLEYEPYSWFGAQPGTPYSLEAVFNWAKQPLVGERIVLTHQAYNTYHLRWAYSAVNLTREALLTLYGAPFYTRASVDNVTTCGGLLPEDNRGIDWAGNFYTPGQDVQEATLLDNEIEPLPQGVGGWPTYLDSETMGTGNRVWQL
jgi:hypothetical protein